MAPGSHPARHHLSRLAPLLFLALALLLLSPPELSAQMELSSAQARTTQYIFVIDDSGSMRVRTSDGPAADPQRLAIFATRSLLSMLDERDEVTVVRLNGPANNEALTSIAPLSQNRPTLERMLSLDGPIAEYAGKYTPCVSALKAVQQELNQAYRPNINQVILFLTDGECNDGNLGPQSWLQGLDSHKDGLFQFYLLRWTGRAYSRYLVDLARQTGGTAVEVGGEDPTELLAPFAQVLSRSQGYEAYQLSPRDQLLPAHQGARRVRLLAIAPDQGQELSFEISSTAHGEDPEEIGSTERGLHQYGDGPRYRYATLDYRPGTAPVNISVTGAADQWKVIALPEYRLFVSAKLLDGPCSQPAEETNFVEVGGQICVTLELVNEEGQRVTPDVTRQGIQASINYRQPGDDEYRRLPANQLGDEPAFQFERVNLSEGDHIISPRITLERGGDGGVTIKGASRTLQVSTRRVEASPARLEMGDLLPGTEHYQEVQIDGNFPTTRARLTVQGREHLPQCLRFALNGVPEGEAQSISAGQKYTVETHVDPYCGPSTGEVEIDTALRLQFDRSAQSAPIPSLVLPIRANLLHELRAPAGLETTISAGDHRDMVLNLGGNHRRDIKFTALIPPRRERPGWPNRHLELIGVDAKGVQFKPDKEGNLSIPITLSAGDDAQKVLTLRAKSDACCQGGQFHTDLVLVPLQGSLTPLRLPVTIAVEETQLWKCWGPTILRGFLLSLLLLLLLYLANMWRSSHFIDRDRLAERLIPLYWSDFGEVRPQSRAAADVRRMVRRSMSFSQRARAWFKANPLIFGLPGRQYHETAHLLLEPSRNIQRSRIRLIDERDYLETLRQNPRRGLGRIFVTAQGGLAFYVVAAEENRVGLLQMHREFDPFTEDDEFEPKLEPLRRRTDLLDSHSDQEPDTIAGWRVG